MHQVHVLILLEDATLFLKSALLKARALSGIG